MAILGIDEVGRGPLAGPLVVGAVVLPEEKPDWVRELKDSKKLTAKKRELLNETILNGAAATGLGWVFVEELDKVGVSAALCLATRRAVKAIQELHIPFSQIVIDGKVNFLKATALEEYVSTMPKADDLICEVSAASIIAKVARDKYMIQISEKYPEYGFSSHVGYGTAKHLAAIREFGVTSEHRKSFEPIKSIVGFSKDGKSVASVVKNTTIIGQKGEAAVCHYLEKLGHEIVVRNHKTRFYEIDIVSVCKDKIYFTEVKYRKSDFRGGGFAAIDDRKINKMKFAAESFMRFEKKFSGFSPQLAVAEVLGEDFEVTEWMPLSF